MHKNTPFYPACFFDNLKPTWISIWVSGETLGPPLMDWEVDMLYLIKCYDYDIRGQKGTAAIC